jgi:hypothetical protein
VHWIVAAVTPGPAKEVNTTLMRERGRSLNVTEAGGFGELAVQSLAVLAVTVFGIGSTA